MNFYSNLSGILPEGKLKNRMRNAFYSILTSLTSGIETLTLDKERSITGRFYKLLLKEYSGCLLELKGYTKDYAPKEGDIVIDAGAFQGNFTVYASKLVGPKGLVIAFEPEDNNFRILVRNIKLNKLTNVRVVKAGLWNKEDILKFKCTGPASCLANFDKEENLVKSVKVFDLDSFLEKIQVKKVDFVKMDIEGAELNALEGMKKLMKKNKINFAIASYHVVNGQQTCNQLEKIFKKGGYKAHTSYPEHLTTYAKKS